MKKIFLIIFTLFAFAGFAQNRMEASIGAGSTTRSVKIYIRPAVSGYVGTISTLQFSVGIPFLTSPIPTLALTTDNLGLAWQIQPSYIEGGYRMYDIVTALSPAVNIAAGAETQVMEVTFSSIGNSTTNVALVTLSGGGATTGNGLFLSTANPGTAGVSLQGQLYYTRTGTTVINNNSYTGALTSSATISAVVLPLRLTDFNAVKKDNNGLVTWTVENQYANADRFVIERSFNGINFTAIGTMPVNVNSGIRNDYSYTDLNIAATRNSGVIYYRLRSYDKDGSFVISDIKNVKLSNIALAMSLSPNPAKAYTNLTFELAAATKVTINISDAAGKTVKTIEINGVKGINQKMIDVSGYPAGMYNFKVQTGTELKTISVIKE